MSQTLDTTSTYFAGYVAAAVIHVAYAVSLWLRGRRLRQRAGDAPRSRR